MAGIRERFGDLLIEARLFGSKARGDSDPESDIDVWLLFERELTPEEDEELLDIWTRTDLDHGTFTQVATDTRARWQQPGYQSGGFGMAVREEGIPL